MIRAVLVDTSYLIALVNDADPLHEDAKRYYKYFLQHSIPMYLSVIVIAEFHQKQSAIDLLGSEKYITLPYNVTEALASADMGHALGSGARVGNRAEFKDDVKLLAQAKNENLEFLITADAATLHKYCEKLRQAGMINTQSICLTDGYDEAWFNPQRQKALGLEP